MQKQIQAILLVFLNRYTQKMNVVHTVGASFAGFMDTDAGVPVKEMLNYLNELGFECQYDTRPEDEGSYQLWVRYHKTEG